MAAEGFSTRRGRRAALLHRDEVHATVRGRRGARLLAQTSGGAIPEVADYRVVLDPDETFVGTLNEDFAIESNAGDIFQLGNASWQILQVTTGVVRVGRRQGRAADDSVLARRGAGAQRRAVARGERSAARWSARPAVGRPRARRTWRTDDVDVARGREPALTRGRPAASSCCRLPRRAAAARSTPCPTQETLVLERFFDESGGMQLVLHAPFGSRINKAWCLALRKRFCRQFNFELQAAATEDALLLSLGPQHSFPLADVFRYLHPETARDVLVQAFLDAPVFKTRWRWNATISLAVPRARGSRRVAPQLQRMLADDLMAAVFPDAAACLENIPGDRQLPDHPLVNQTVRDCLQEAMDFDGLRAVLRAHPSRRAAAARARHARAVGASPTTSSTPSRTRSWTTRRSRSGARTPCRRGAAATDGGRDARCSTRRRSRRCAQEAAPDPRDADELHDALMTCGLLTAGEAGVVRPGVAARRSPRPAAPRCVTLPSQLGAVARGRGAAARDGGRFIRAWPPIRALPSPRRDAPRHVDAAPRRSPSSCGAG